MTSRLELGLLLQPELNCARIASEVAALGPKSNVNVHLGFFCIRSPIWFRKPPIHTGLNEIGSKVAILGPKSKVNVHLGLYCIGCHLWLRKPPIDTRLSGRFLPTTG